MRYRPSSSCCRIGWWRKLTSILVIGGLLFTTALAPLAEAKGHQYSKDQLRRETGLPESGMSERIRDEMVRIASARIGAETARGIMESYRRKIEIAGLEKLGMNRTGRGFLQMREIVENVSHMIKQQRDRLIRMFNGRGSLILAETTLSHLPNAFWTRMSAPHISALHAGTLVELVTMIYENHRDYPELDQIIWNGEKSFNGLFREVVIAINRAGDNKDVKYDWNERDINRYSRSNPGVLTEFLRLYLRDYKNVPDLNVSKFQMTAEQRDVVKEMEEAAKREIASGGLFRFLGLEHVGIRVVKDKVRIGDKDVTPLIRDMNRHIVAYYTDDGEWEEAMYGRDFYAFRKGGEIVVGFSAIEELEQLKRRDPAAASRRIFELVMRELMARMLNQYGDLSKKDQDIYDRIKKLGYGSSFNKIHKIIDDYPDSKEVVELILSDFQAFETLDTEEIVCGLDPTLRNNRQIVYLNPLRIEVLVKGFPSQEELLSFAKKVVTKVISPVILFGITFGSWLASPGLALDSQALTISQDWVGWVIGAIVSGALFYHQLRNHKHESKKIDVPDTIHRIAHILGETPLINKLFSFYNNVLSTAEEGGVRLLTNIKELKENPARVNRLKEFAVESAKKENMGNPYEIVIVTDEENIARKEEVVQFLIDSQVPLDHIRVLSHPFVNSTFDLNGLIGKKENKLTGDGYHLRVIGKSYWLRVKELLKDGVLILNWSGYIEEGLTEKRTVRVAA